MRSNMFTAIAAALAATSSTEIAPDTTLHISRGPHRGIDGRRISKTRVENRKCSSHWQTGGHIWRIRKVLGVEAGMNGLCATVRCARCGATDIKTVTRRPWENKRVPWYGIKSV